MGSACRPLVAQRAGWGQDARARWGGHGGRQAGTEPTLQTLTVGERRPCLTPGLGPRMQRAWRVLWPNPRQCLRCRGQCTCSEDSNMSPPRTPLHIVKPALGSPWAGTYHSHRFQRVCRGHPQTSSLGGKTEEKKSEPQCTMGCGPAGPGAQGPHDAGGLLQ